MRKAGDTVMKLLIRLFTILIIAATVLTATVLFLQVIHGDRYGSSNGPAQPSYVEEETRGFGSWFLSRLKLLPSGKLYRTPVAVMVENHEDARPHQAGMEDALMVEEFLVEGFISRFAVVYDLDDLPRTMGPVRSLRPYFVEGLSPWVRTIFHAGGSPEAIDMVAKEPSIISYNGLIYYDHFFRNEEIPAPHNLFLHREELEDLLEQQPKEIPWPPYDLGGLQDGTGATTISINFFSPVHNVQYTYNSIVGTYTRMNGEVESHAKPRNVILLQIPIVEIGEFGRLKMDMTGEGDLLFFRGGRMIPGRWKKEDLLHPFIFETEDGEPIQFSTGLTWMTVVPDLGRVEWKG